MNVFSLRRGLLSALVSLCFVQSVQALAKYEPPNGSIYYGYCLSGYWSDAEFDHRIEQTYQEVSDKPFLLASIFVHAMENGRWNGWSYRPEGPNGKYVHGSGDYVKAVVDRGYIPVLAWTWMDWSNHATSPSLQGVVRGEYDWYIDEWIEGIKSIDSPIFIRLSHEMDGYWYPYSEGFHGDPDRNTAEDFIAYWRYIVDRFRAAGVDNVAWIWCVDGGRIGVRDWPDYYPGDEYVDWLGIDVYSNRNGGEALKEFRDVMGTHKPIMIPEGGTEDLLTAWHPNYPGNNAWIDEFYTTMLEEMDGQVKAMCWFQWNDVSDVQRDPGQIATYRKYAERPEFINTFYEGGESGGSDIPTEKETEQPSLPADGPPACDVPNTLELDENGLAKTVFVETANLDANFGGRWDVEAGDPNGLEIIDNLSSATIRGLKPGEYTVKAQFWDKDSHVSDYLTVTVGGSSDGGSSEPVPSGPAIVAPDWMELEIGGDEYILESIFSGFTATGSRWDVEIGDASGLELRPNGETAFARANKTGEYVVKVQAWNGPLHVSKHIRVTVVPASKSAEPTQPQIVAPDTITLKMGSLPFKIDGEYVGFAATGGRWDVELGDKSGLICTGAGEDAYLQVVKPGVYTVKAQAWNNSLHVSKHIEVTVTGF